MSTYIPIYEHCMHVFLNVYLCMCLYIDNQQIYIHMRAHKRSHTKKKRYILKQILTNNTTPSEYTGTHTYSCLLPAACVPGLGREAQRKSSMKEKEKERGRGKRQRER